MRDEDCCKNCRFWNIESRGKYRASEKAGAKRGQCRRCPPHPYAGWALTLKDDWCGEFEKKEEGK